MLLLEIDPRESLYQLLDLPPSGGGVVRAVPGLYVQNLQPRAVLDRMVREQLRLGLVADRVLSSPVYRHFAEGAPGLKEMAVLGHALRVVQGRPDSEAPRGRTWSCSTPRPPATASRCSAAPLLVSEVIRDGPFGQHGQASWPASSPTRPAAASWSPPSPRRCRSRRRSS